jgi:isoquinoline 1-oxidoreductase subunit beta
MPRSMLLEAAGTFIRVAAHELSIDRGVVKHATRAETFTLGVLAEQASWLPPREAEPKARAAYRMLGKTGMPRLDVPAKVDGSATFGMDVRLPGQLYAAIRHCPTLGGAVKSVTWPTQTNSIKGVVQERHFVAAIASNWWSAKQHVEGATVSWEDGPMASVNSDAVMAQMTRAVAQADSGESKVFETRGDPRTTVPGGRSVEANYQVPFLAHATMEPMNCTAWFKPATGQVPASCDLWLGNQAPLLTKWMLASVAGVERDQLTVNTPFLGGGFGRRIELDVATAAVQIAKSMPGVPVQTIWSREEDMRHDMYRPAAAARLSAQLDASGLPVTLKAHASCASVAYQFMTRMMGSGANAKGDRANVDGLTHLPYGIPNLEIRHTLVDAGVPVGFWRSVGHSQNAYFAECFIDECAAAAGQDPLAYRLALLKRRPNDPIAQRAIKLLEALASKAAWGKFAGPPKRSGGALMAQGLALAESFRSIVAQVAEVEVGPDDKLVKVHKVVAAVDCGFALDPVNVQAQVRSAVHFGLAAALWGRIDVKAGQVQQGNFNDYRIGALAGAPTVEVLIVNSAGPLGGIGEVGVPPIAPAIANAVRAITGQTPRRLPLLG